MCKREEHKKYGDEKGKRKPGYANLFSDRAVALMADLRFCKKLRVVCSLELVMEININTINLTIVQTQRLV